MDEARALGVTILFAVESGSRAWGFPSPDSDYDCRFIYARGVSDHLVLEPQRDVIEFPIEGLIDVGGWDLRKAIKLALKGNAVVQEWLNSPIIYEQQTAATNQLEILLPRITDPFRVARHYLGLVHSGSGLIADEARPVKLKNLLYVIRPVLALDWMKERDYRAVPPMQIGKLLNGVSVDELVSRSINDLIALKAETREIGEGPAPAEILRYLALRYGEHQRALSELPKSLEGAKRRILAENGYRQVIATLDD